MGLRMLAGAECAQKTFDCTGVMLRVPRCPAQGPLLRATRAHIARLQTQKGRLTCSLREVRVDRTYSRIRIRAKHKRHESFQSLLISPRSSGLHTPDRQTM